MTCLALPDRVAVRLPDGRELNLDRNELQQLKEAVCQADKELMSRQREAIHERNFSLF